jgi:hypothetical protein
MMLFSKKTIVNVRKFRVKPGASAEANDAGIATAMAAIGQLGGGELYFPPGIYSIGSTITMGEFPLHIRGAGWHNWVVDPIDHENWKSARLFQGTILRYTAPAGCLFSFVRTPPKGGVVARQRISDIMLIGNGSAQQAKGICLTQGKHVPDATSTDVIIRNVMAANFHAGYSVESALDTRFHHCMAFGCNYGFYNPSQKEKDAGVTDTVLYDFCAEACSAGIRLEGCSEVKFYNPLLQANVDAVHLVPKQRTIDGVSHYGSLELISFIGGWFEAQSGNEIVVDTTEGYATWIVFDRCRCSDDGAKIVLRSPRYSGSITFRDCAWAGITLPDRTIPENERILLRFEHTKFANFGRTVDQNTSEFFDSFYPFRSLSMTGDENYSISKEGDPVGRWWEEPISTDFLRLDGAPAAESVTLTMPSVSHTMFVWNNMTKPVNFKTAFDAGVWLSPGEKLKLAILGQRVVPMLDSTFVTLTRITGSQILHRHPQQRVNVALTADSILTLPGSPRDGDWIEIADVLGNIPATYTFSVAANAGHTIVGKPSFPFSSAYASVKLVFSAVDSLWSAYIFSG